MSDPVSSLGKISGDKILNSFLNFHMGMGLALHANCLLRRQFA